MPARAAATDGTKSMMVCCASGSWMNRGIIVASAVMMKALYFFLPSIKFCNILLLSVADFGDVTDYSDVFVLCQLFDQGCQGIGNWLTVFRVMPHQVLGGVEDLLLGSFDPLSPESAA